MSQVWERVLTAAIRGTAYNFDNANYIYRIKSTHTLHGWDNIYIGSTEKYTLHSGVNSWLLVDQSTNGSKNITIDFGTFHLERLATTNRYWESVAIGINITVPIDNSKFVYRVGLMGNTEGQIASVLYNTGSTESSPSNIGLKKYAHVPTYLNGDTIIKNTSGADGIEVQRLSLNKNPIIALSTTNNRTLYENDAYIISGSSTDSDAGNVVSVKYQLNGGTERAITTGISTGAPIPFNRSLTFKGGMLYDGSNAVTPALAESTTHSLRVWAEDDKGGKSAEQTRLFTVVANRPAALTIEPFATVGNLIDSDTMTIKGSVTDPENNTIIVRYKISSGSFVEVLNGVGGPFTIPIKLSALKAGANAVTIQATDSYGAVSSKTLNIAKSGNVQPLLTSVVRYKINPPNSTAKGVLLWIEREVGDLIVDVEISATMAGEAESFVPMIKSSTAFVIDGIEEDEFTHDAVTPKDNIVLKLTMTRASTATNSGIKLISGVLS